jgi:2-methylisocitrate lyase-like PEP mutase family enzyme
MSHDPGAMFRALHRPGDPFVLANAWDAGSARMLAALGAQAIGTTSAGYAFTLGRPDMGQVTRDEALAHAEALVAATPLSVSGDLENGYGDAPEDVAQTVRRAAEVGLAGCSIEDTALPGADAYPRAAAVQRIRAAVAAARSLARDFVLVARADGVMNGAYDLDEAIARVRAFEAVGADCVYVPAPGGKAELARVVAAVSVPVNALAVGPLAQLGRTQFAALGVARISLGSALARMTHRVIYDAAQAMLGQGRFDSHPVVSGKAVDELLLKGAH